MTSILRVLGVILIWTQAKAEPQTTPMGATLHVNCQVYSGSRTVVWYKLDSSKRLHLMVSVNSLKGENLYKNSRYSIQSSEDSNTLRVSRVRWEDAGTYYCGVIDEYGVSFEPGTEVVVVEGKSSLPPSLQSVVQSPDYIRVQPGDSVTLSCWFNTSLCTKEHISVQWKKKSSTSEIISWSNETKNIICENQVNTGETSYVHNLTLTWKDLSSAEDETYVCVVTACGHTLQGRGTRIYLQNITHSFSPNVMAVIGSNIVVGLVVFVLLWGIWRSSNKSEMDTYGHRSSYNSRDDDTLAYTAGSSVASSQLTPMKHRRDPDIYSQVWYYHRE
ncbi:uncharacterized protein LOC129409829 [Boleophthalmus pectinirostris]|uniref:uncharacterized protein LOC129409829 n=1 Tax=Boleophthalmus pectinirostris TaxID=150288 RepID=UPI00242EB875|nr:uncharacterized protein LOC129409829 [Boleophthalmus pectinirostris]